MTDRYSKRSVEVQQLQAVSPTYPHIRRRWQMVFGSKELMLSTKVRVERGGVFYLVHMSYLVSLPQKEDRIASYLHEEAQRIRKYLVDPDGKDFENVEIDPNQKP